VASRRTDIRKPLLAAAVFMLLEAVAVLFLTSRSPVDAIVAVTALFGLMSGTHNVTNQAALYREAPAEQVGTAAGLLRTFGYVGSIASATITGIVSHGGVDDTDGADPDQDQRNMPEARPAPTGNPVTVAAPPAAADAPMRPGSS
jgi:predicted MFS family arabinose efflux permease